MFNIIFSLWEFVWVNDCTVYICLVFYIVDDLVCRVQLTYRRSDHQISIGHQLDRQSLIVGHIIGRIIIQSSGIVYQDYRRLFNVSDYCISALYVYLTGPSWGNFLYTYYIRKLTPHGYYKCLNS